MFFGLVMSMGLDKQKTESHEELQILCCNALRLSHKDSMVTKAHCEVHIGHASCILLESAMLIASCFVNN